MTCCGNPLPPGVQVVLEGRTPDIPSSTPGWLQDLLRSCWARNPQERPHAAAVLAALQVSVTLQGLPASSFPPWPGLRECWFLGKKIVAGLIKGAAGTPACEAHQTMRDAARKARKLVHGGVVAAGL